MHGGCVAKQLTKRLTWIGILGEALPCTGEALRCTGDALMMNSRCIPDVKLAHSSRFTPDACSHRRFFQDAFKMSISISQMHRRCQWDQGFGIRHVLDSFMKGTLLPPLLDPLSKTSYTCSPHYYHLELTTLVWR